MMAMTIKRALRRFGFDLVRYHPLYEQLLVSRQIEIVLDIGASDGQYAKSVRALLPDAFIYSFEPLKDVYEKLKRNMAGDTRFKALNIGLGERSGVFAINRSSFSPSSSFLQMADMHKKLFPKTAGASQEEVKVERLDDVRGIEIRGNLLVKMDVQGFEDSVIRGGTQTISRASMLVIETAFVPLYAGQPLFDDIVAMLHPLGFSYRGVRERHWDPRTNEPLYQDSIFVRR